eukprot:g3685.t1
MFTSASKLRKRVQELEAKVKQLEEDKNLLYDDLDQNLTRRRHSFWLPSNLQNRRLSRSENERQLLEAQLSRVTAERDFFQENNIQIQRVKSNSDAITQEQLEAKNVLERELEFYKKQCQRALDHRDVLALELEALRKTKKELDRNLVLANERLQMEQKRREDNETQKQKALNRVSELEVLVVECARIPELETQLQTLNTQYNKLETELDNTKRSAKSTKEKFEQTKVMLESCIKERDSLKQKLEVEESKNREVEATGLTPMERVRELELELSKKNEQLSCKTAALTTAIEGKTAALQIAAEMEAKWNELNQNLQEQSSGPEGTGSPMRKKSTESASANGKGNHRWTLFRRARITEESGAVQEDERDNNALESVRKLVPKLKCIHESLKKAQPTGNRSMGESLTSLYEAQERIKRLQNELDNVKFEGEDYSTRNSIHVLIGKEAVGLASNSVTNLQKLLTPAL